MRSTLVFLLLAACGSDESSGVAAALLWVENLNGTDATSVRMIVGPNDKITVAAYNDGVVNLSGQTGGELGAAGQKSLLVARFTDGQGLTHVWSKAFPVEYTAAPRLALAVTANGDIAIGTGAL